MNTYRIVLTYEGHLEGDRYEAFIGTKENWNIQELYLSHMTPTQKCPMDHTYVYMVTAGKTFRKGGNVFDFAGLHPIRQRVNLAKHGGVANVISVLETGTMYKNKVYPPIEGNVVQPIQGLVPVVKSPVQSPVQNPVIAQNPIVAQDPIVQQKPVNEDITQIFETILNQRITELTQAFENKLDEQTRAFETVLNQRITELTQAFETKLEEQRQTILNLNQRLEEKIQPVVIEEEKRGLSPINVVPQVQKEIFSPDDLKGFNRSEMKAISRDLLPDVVTNEFILELGVEQFKLLHKDILRDILKSRNLKHAQKTNVDTYIQRLLEPKPTDYIGQRSPVPIPQKTPAPIPVKPDNLPEIKVNVSSPIPTAKSLPKLAPFPLIIKKINN